MSLFFTKNGLKNENPSKIPLHAIMFHYLPCFTITTQFAKKRFETAKKQMKNALKVFFEVKKAIKPFH